MGHAHPITLGRSELITKTGSAPLALQIQRPQSRPFSSLGLAAYSFAGGNLWPLVLLSVLIAPYLVARWQGERHDKSG